MAAHRAFGLPCQQSIRAIAAHATMPAWHKGVGRAGVQANCTLASTSVAAPAVSTSVATPGLIIIGIPARSPPPRGPRLPGPDPPGCRDHSSSTPQANPTSKAQARGQENYRRRPPTRPSTASHGQVPRTKAGEIARGLPKRDQVGNASQESDKNNGLPIKDATYDELFLAGL